MEMLHDIALYKFNIDIDADILNISQHRNKVCFVLDIFQIKADDTVVLDPCDDYR